MPPLVQETTRYSLRNFDNIGSKPFLKSFEQYVHRIIFQAKWNLHPLWLLKRNITEPPKYYNVGTRKGQILYARLRFAWSSFIGNSPSCQCEHFKSAAHFLLHCPIYINKGQGFLPLYRKGPSVWKRNASELENEQLFLQVQEFILVGQEDLLNSVQPRMHMLTVLIW